MNNTSSLNPSHDMQFMAWDNSVKGFAMILITQIWSTEQQEFLFCYHVHTDFGACPPSDSYSVGPVGVYFPTGKAATADHSHASTAKIKNVWHSCIYLHGTVSEHHRDYLICHSTHFLQDICFPITLC